VLTQLPANSLQGDAAFLEILERMGARVEQHDDAVDVTARQVDRDRRRHV